MRELHLVVCVKAVPKPEEVGVDPETLRLDRARARNEINPPDMNAMELALTVKDRHSSLVTILSMGPPFFEEPLRACLAMGADRIVLLSDRAFAGADTLATTYTLAQGVRKLGGADLIFCGEESSDGATGQVPSGLAEWLGLPQLTLVTDVKMDLRAGEVQGRREISGGYEVLAVPMPAVISVRTAANEPRFMDFRRKAWAFDEGRVTVWDQDALACDPALIGEPGSPTIVTGLAEAPMRARRREYLTGTPAEMAARIATLLRGAVREP
jgi:electron transfer flavoprotein beta subunit